MNDSKTSPTRIGAHRGLPLVFPDNTLEGIVAAAEVADFIELDVRRSSDGRMVLSHDPTIGDLVIAETPWDTLHRVDLDGYRPALLDDVLEALPNTPLDIEIKNFPYQPGFDPDGAFAVEVAALARPFDVVTCFYWPAMDAVRRAHPAVRTGLLVYGEASLDDVGVAAVAGGHAVVAPHVDLVLGAPGSVGRFHETGLEVIVWTVNDAEVVRVLAREGVDGIISDDPGRFRQEQQP